MEVLEAIRRRRAVREYTDRPVGRATIDELLAAAVQAPSAVNQQPWAFVVIQNRDLLRQYSDRSKEYWARTMSGDASWEHLRGLIVDPTFRIFYDAPALIVICARPGGLNPAEDCCLAAENLMLAAHALGLGTCPIGLARPWLNLPETKQELGIPEQYAPVFPVIVGYPRGEVSSPGRNAPEVLVWKS